VVQCGTLAAAVQQAHRAASPGDTVLLAPACASFDQFESYEQRGRIFKELVRALAEGAN
jgi:UDP-N-acetylmuramoylalanine--D-glutamate ligase